MSSELDYFMSLLDTKLMKCIFLKKSFIYWMKQKKQYFIFFHGAWQHGAWW